MQVLIAIKSCHRDRKAGFHQAIRETWGKDLPKGVLLRFFMGLNPDTRDGSPMPSDEIILNCSDDYLSLPFKTREITKWMLHRMIDYVYLCDNDTVVKPKALFQLPLLGVDYGGYFGKGESLTETFHYQDHTGEYPESWPWASGGYGYFLSRQAAVEVAETFPKFWAEDMYVGQVIGPHAQKGWLRSVALPMLDVVTHFRKSAKFPTFTPDLLRRIYLEGGPEKIYAEARNDAR